MIFYFSGTGNSKDAAVKIAGSLGEQVVDIAEAFYEEDKVYTIKPGEKAGFIFPVYYYGPPTIVADFVKALDLCFEDQPYIYTVMTCGNNVGATDRLMDQLLKKKGYAISAHHTLVTVDNFIFGYDLVDEEDRATALKKAEERLKGIIKSIQVQGVADKPSGAVDKLLTKSAYLLYLRGRKTKKFYADTKCISCNLCRDICPAKAIEMVDGKPQWIKNQCIHCVACINRCPVEAIQYGPSTSKRRRYIHPNI